MTQKITQRVREFRKNPTSTEVILWQLLRNRRLNGYKSVRQHPIQVLFKDEIRYYIADFYCHEKRLIIEVDGKIHDYQMEYDEYRTFVISQLGINVYRIKNEEVCDVVGITEKIREFL